MTVAQEFTRSSEAWCAARCALILLSTERDSFRPDKRLTILTPRARALAELLTQISFEHFNLIVSSDVGTNYFIWRNSLPVILTHAVCERGRMLTVPMSP